MPAATMVTPFERVVARTSIAPGDSQILPPQCSMMAAEGGRRVFSISRAFKGGEDLGQRRHSRDMDVFAHSHTMPGTFSHVSALMEVTCHLNP